MTTITRTDPDTNITYDVDVAAHHDTQGDHAAGLVGSLVTVQPVSARLAGSDEPVDLGDVPESVNEYVAALRPRDL